MKKPSIHKLRSGFKTTQILQLGINFVGEIRPYTVCGISFLLSLAVYLILIPSAFDFIIDDTFISMRYAIHLAKFGELTWNLDEPVKTEGYSNLLWILTLASAFKFLPGDPLILTKLLSILFGALTLGAMCLLAGLVFQKKRFVCFCTLLLAVSKPFIFWSCSGMETTLYTFLICLSFYFLIREEMENKLFLITPVILFAVWMTRTEGIVFFVAAFIYRTWIYIKTGGTLSLFKERKWICWNLIYGGLSVLWMSWKLFYYRALIPLPVLVKGGDSFMGMKYVQDFIEGQSPFVPLVLIAICSGSLRGERLHIYITLALGLYLWVISTVDPLMGMEYRLLLGALPLFYILGMMGLERLTDHTSIRNSNTAMVFVFLYLAQWITGNPELYRKRLRNEAASYKATLDSVHIPMGIWFDHIRAEKPALRIALADAGATAYYSKAEVIDFFGLNDVNFARNKPSPISVLNRNPDFIVLKSRSKETFQKTYSEYGRLSDLIYNDPRFQTEYLPRKIYFCAKPYYCLWVFEKISL